MEKTFAERPFKTMKVNSYSFCRASDFKFGFDIANKHYKLSLNDTVFFLPVSFNKL